MINIEELENKLHEVIELQYEAIEAAVGILLEAHADGGEDFADPVRALFEDVKALGESISDVEKLKDFAQKLHYASLAAESMTN